MIKINLKEIYENIINDEENISYTKRNIYPLYQVSENSKILIIGQAPGIKAENNNKLFLDKSGDTLREWLGVSSNTFYDDNVFAILPMDFYYPGKAKTGDLPPRKGFADKWHSLILENLKNVELIILIGSYAQNYYLKEKKSLTETVKDYKMYLPKYIVTPHPSPLNFRWFNKNPFFLEEVIPLLKEKVQNIIK